MELLLKVVWYVEPLFASMGPSYAFWFENQEQGKKLWIIPQVSNWF